MRNPWPIQTLDTDGYDFEVLRGGRQTLATHRPVLFFELAPRLVPTVTLDLEWLREIGYQTFVCLSADTEGEVVGVTPSPTQAVSWAGGDKSGFCNVLTCFEGSEPSKRLHALLDNLQGGRIPIPPLSHYR